MVLFSLIGSFTRLVEEIGLTIGCLIFELFRMEPKPAVIRRSMPVPLPLSAYSYASTRSHWRGGYAGVGLSPARISCVNNRDAI